MKLLLILLPILLSIELNNPVRNQTKDENLIQNTNIRFNSIDFSKLEIKFYQVGCFNHDRYRMNFTTANNGLYINVYGYSTSDCENLKINSEDSDKLLVRRYMRYNELNNIKNILITDQTKNSTMLNIININYNGSNYRFHDNSISPNWKKYINNLTKHI